MHEVEAEGQSTTQINSLQNLNVIRVIEAIEEFWAKSWYKTKTKTK